MFYVMFLLKGPMTSTIGDFWRLVWQTCCGKIVMLTNLKEKNKVSSQTTSPPLGFSVGKIAIFGIKRITQTPPFQIKCVQYWPNKGSTLEFGLYKISVQAEKTHITYVQRALRLEDMTVRH